MRPLLALLLTLALPASADSISDEIARNGLARTAARLTALPTPADLFALGGVQFPRAVQLSFQDRWHHGLTDHTGLMPFLRLPIGENPNPAAFDPRPIHAVRPVPELIPC